jgi:hypothetical protein
MTLLYILGTVTIILLGLMAWKFSTFQAPSQKDEEVKELQSQKEELIRASAELKATLAKKTEELGEVKALLETERTEKNEQQGKSKQLFANFTKLEAKHEELQKERDALKKLITQHEAETKEREGEARRMIAQLTQAEQALKEERVRVIKEEQEEQKRAAEERDRMWAEHEVNVIAALSDLCKQPQFAFTSFSNTNLPDDFDGSLKPDFMIDFLGQYVVFDAKVSKAESLQTYINDTVKRTAEKVKKNSKIFPVVFLVVPTNAISELSKTYYPKDDYSFYVISPEAVAPILWSLKRITHYELAEQLDPQQREAIVHLVADLDYHISWRNAMDIAIMNHGIETLQKVQKLHPDMVEQINQKKLEKKPPVPSNAELKRMIGSPMHQQEELQELIEPRAAVHKNDVAYAETVLKIATKKNLKISASESEPTLL